MHRVPPGRLHPHPPVAGVKPATLLPPDRPRAAPAGCFRRVRAGVCRGCRNPTPTGKGQWCGPACVAVVRAVRDPDELRRRVFDRDRGLCSDPDCRLDTYHLEVLLAAWRRSRHKRHRKFPERFRAETGCGRHRKTFWDADHVVPVRAGGGLSVLANLRTLCVWCHVRRASPGRPTGEAVVRPVLNRLRAEAAEIRKDHPKTRKK